MTLVINKSFKKGILCFFLFLLYKLICDYSYYLLSSSAYSMEFALDFNIYKYVAAIILLTIAYLLTIGKNDTIVFFLRMIIFFTLIPMSSVVGMRNENFIYYSLVMVIFSMVEWYVLNYRIITPYSKKISHREFKSTETKAIESKSTLTWMAKNVSWICGFLSIILILIMYRNHGLPSLIALNVYDVYKVRGAAVIGKIESYLMAIVTGVFVPFGIAEGVVQKKPIRVIMFTLFQCLIYLWTGNKIYAFSILLIYFILFLYKWKMSSTIFFATFTGIAFLGCLSSMTNMKILDLIFTVYNRRMVLDSSALKFFYYDYFIINKNPTTGFAGTLFAPFIKIRGTNEYRYLLYEKYAGSVSNANTGIFGGDIASLGMLAFIVVPILLIILIRYIQRINDELGQLFSLVLFSYIIYRLNETCIFMFFFDFTGIALVILVFLYRVKKSFMNNDRNAGVLKMNKGW